VIQEFLGQHLLPNTIRCHGTQLKRVAEEKKSRHWVRVSKLATKGLSKREKDPAWGTLKLRGRLRQNKTKVEKLKNKGLNPGIKTCADHGMEAESKRSPFKTGRRRGGHRGGSQKIINVRYPREKEGPSRTEPVPETKKKWYLEHGICQGGGSQG